MKQTAEYCIICAKQLWEHNCKLLCRWCGYTETCSELFIKEEPEMLVAYCLGCGKELDHVSEDYCDDCQFLFEDEDPWWDGEDWDDDEDDPFLFMPEDF